MIEQARGQSRQDVQQLFGAAQQNLLAGQQAGLDLRGQVIPQQLETFQQGNIAAQQQLLGGLPQVQNALLGLPTDLTGFQPTRINFDPSFAQQQLPQFQSPELTTFVPPPPTPEELAIQEAQAQAQAAQARVQSQPSGQIFGGLFGGNR